MLTIILQSKYFNGVNLWKSHIVQEFLHVMYQKMHESGGGANHEHCAQSKKMQNHSSLRAHLHIPMIIAYGGSSECASPQIIMK